MRRAARLCKRACCPNPRKGEGGWKAFVAATQEWNEIASLAIAAGHRPALRDLGNAPRSYGGQGGRRSAEARMRLAGGEFGAFGLVAQTKKRRRNPILIRQKFKICDDIC